MDIKILVIDENLTDYIIFTNSILSDVKIIKYNNSSNINEILNLIQNTNNNIYLGFVYHNHNNKTIPFYTNNLKSNNLNSNNTIVKSNNIKQKTNVLKDLKDNIKPSYTYPIMSNNLVKLFNTLSVNNKVTFDLLTCDNYENYTNISNQLNITIRSSTDPIGNVDVNGNNWVLNNPSIVSIKSFYFNPILIDKWNHDLIGGIDLSTSIKNSTSILSPYIKYNNGTYNVINNFTWPYDPSTDDNYIQLIDNEIFNGNNYTITFGPNGVYNNHGIFTSGYSGSGNIPIIKNLIIKSYIIGDQYGGFMQQGQVNYNIINCHHIGNIIGTNCGGIASTMSSIDSSSSGNYTIIIDSCSHTGDIINSFINGNGGNGGICGGGIANIIVFMSGPGPRPNNITMNMNITIKNCNNN